MIYDDDSRDSGLPNVLSAEGSQNSSCTTQANEVFNYCTLLYFVQYFRRFIVSADSFFVLF